MKFQIASIDKKKFVDVEGYVDTGAVYSIIPADLLERIGVKRKRRVVVKGICCKKEVWIGDALFRIIVDGEILEGVSSVIFGDDPELVLLGSHALEALGLEVDVTNKKLKKASYMIMYYSLL